MTSVLYELINDNGEASTAAYSKFKTPRLPRLEELKVLEFWKVLLEFLDLESEVVETYGIPIWNLMDEKMVEKHGANLTLTSLLRKRLDTNPPSLSGKMVKNASSGDKSHQEPLMYPKTSNSVSVGRGYSQDDLRTCRRLYWKETRDFHPDELIIRFLVQQDWDIGKAFARLVLCGKFQEKIHLEALLRSGEEGAVVTAEESKIPAQREVATQFLRQCRIGKTFVRGPDWEGRPVVITRMRFNEQDLESLNDFETIKRYVVWSIEMCRLTFGPEVTDVVQKTSIWDFTGVKREITSPSPSKFLIELFQKHYPGAFCVLILHNTPKFYQRAWNIVKHLLSSKGIAKIKFTRSISELEKYVPRQNLTKDLGSDKPWEFTYIPPVPGENDHMKYKDLEKSVWEEFAELWYMFENYTRTMSAMASQGLDYTAVKTRRNAVVDFLRASYWKLDPFVRAKSFYDRSGQIGLRRDTAFMALTLTYGRGINYRTAQLDKAAASAISDLADKEESADQVS